jgi:hypothetical protein
MSSTRHSTRFVQGEILCRSVLGKDFISPAEMAGIGNFSYSEEMLLNFTNNVPSFDTLLMLKKNNYVLIAGPTSDVNFLDIHECNSEFFSIKSKNRFEKEGHSFVKGDVVRAGSWLMLRKKEVPDSRLANWDCQCDLVTRPERVPNVAEVIYGILAYRKLRKVNLLPDFFVRTSSTDKSGDHVMVGGGNCLCVDSYCNRGRLYSLGVSSAMDN